jgi:hypothetical protein
MVVFFLKKCNLSILLCTIFSYKSFVCADDVLLRIVVKMSQQSRRSLQKLWQHDWIVPCGSGVERYYEGWLEIASVLVHYWTKYVKF